MFKRLQAYTPVGLLYIVGVLFVFYFMYSYVLHGSLKTLRHGNARLQENLEHDHNINSNVFIPERTDLNDEQIPEGIIDVAVLTINPYWLFELRLNQRKPLVYECPHTNRSISVWSAYLNATLTRGADVVIFSRSMDHRHWRDVFAERTPHQVWVYGSSESAYKSPQVRDADRPVGFGHFRFNMSFSYHSMSDVVAPYGEYVAFERTNEKPDFSFLKRKTKLAAWVSSHCDMQQWDRVGFVHALSELLPIDKYGKCGNLSLRSGNHAVRTIKSYKFYFALENSCCSDYITEKFWMALTTYQAVPVVIGAKREEYERVAPPNSFIFADDYDSAVDLAAYLRDLASDDARYAKFHDWRRNGDARLYTSSNVYAFTSQNSACALLDFLEKNAWGHRPLQMSFDPFGSEWLGSCEICGDNAWLRSFNLNSDAYHPTMRAMSQRPETCMKEKLQSHRLQIARQFTERTGA